ncbi:MAG: 50S ribosomal protein L6 [Deltaproteobacteria bacterium]|nr:50S ribosomal protein L6 [Deltaproteobacteria bacterium]
MSRTGKQPINLPDKVKVRLENGVFYAEGPLGKLSQAIRDEVLVEISDKTIEVKRVDDKPQSRALHGLTRSLINNMIVGVSDGFTKELDIQGVGYRADAKGQTLNLSLGFSHPVEFPLPQGIQVKVDKQTHIVLTGYDKALLGQVAADIRKLRPPEPYKGKGIRYSNEVIRRKAGKTAAK